MPEPILVSIAAALATKDATGLYDLVKRKFAKDPAAATTLGAASPVPEDTQPVTTLAERLRQTEGDDHEFACALRAEWQKLPESRILHSAEVPPWGRTLILGFGLGKDVFVSGSSKYPEKFRQDAVALARSAPRPMAQVARELGVNHETLRTWVKAADRAEHAAGERAGGGQDQERELRALRRRVAELEKEKEILRKAAPVSRRRWVVDLQLPVHLRTPRRLWCRPAVPCPSGAPPGVL